MVEERFNPARKECMKSLLLILSIAIFSPTSFAEESVPKDAPLTGTIELTPAGSFQFWTTQVTGKISKTATGYTAPVLEVQTATIKTGLPLRDDHMKNKYMEVAKYPKAYLRDVVGAAGKFKATLEAHGVKKPVEGTYEIVNNRVQAKFKINQTEFGIPKTKYMGVGADDEVEMRTNIPMS
jgi:polyisoprenoid-binding protein YceI